MRHASVLFIALAALLAAGGGAAAQDANRSGWLASGVLIGGRAQYRFPQSTEYTTGFDGGSLFAVKTGDRFDTPVLGNGLGYGAEFGFVACAGPKYPAGILDASWAMSTGSGDSSIGSLSYASHEIDLVAEALFPVFSGFAATAQIGWNLDFFSIDQGLLPSGGSRSRMLLTSFVGFDIGAGVAYAIGKRCLLEGKGVFRLIGYNLASGGGAFDSLGTEIGRAETSIEASVAWIF